MFLLIRVIWFASVVKAFEKFTICFIIYIYLIAIGVILSFCYIFKVLPGWGLVIYGDSTNSNFGPSALLLYCNLLMCIINIGLISIFSAFMPKIRVLNVYSH